jgi:polygalacturonase
MIYQIVYNLARMRVSILAAELAVFMLACSGCSPSSVYGVRSCGALGDGKTKDTAAFQAALDRCGNSGGGTVTVPAGTYVIGSISIRANTVLKLESGAAIVGSPDLADYPLMSVRWEGRWVPGHRALISAMNADHIAIVGPGSISADPKLGGRAMPRRPVLIEPINCTDVLLDGFSTRHKLMWSIHPTYCRDVRAIHLTIRSTGGNGDGIDVDSCSGVTIDGCDIDTGDDCVAIKSGRGLEGYSIAKPSEHIVISNCRLGDSNFACIGIGSEASGSIRDVRIEHCTFTHAKSDAIYIKTRIGRGGRIDDIFASDLDVTAPGFLRINLLNSGILGADPVPGDKGVPGSANLKFTDVKVNCGTLIDAKLISPIKPLDGLVVERVSGTCTRGIDLVNITHAELSDLKLSGYKGQFLTTQNVTFASK